MREDPTPEPGDLDRPPFSNGSQSEIWMDNVCGAGEGCIHDSHFGQSDEELGAEVLCPLITLSYMGVWPHEWAEREIVTEHGSYTTPGACSEYADDLPADPGPAVVAVDLFGVYNEEPGS